MQAERAEAWGARRIDALSGRRFWILYEPLSKLLKKGLYRGTTIGVVNGILGV